MKIGILGGRFDPPHFGHLTIAEKAKKKYELDEVWLVPSNRGNLRAESQATAEQRMAMLRILTCDNKGFKVSDIDIKRGGVTYTIDTVRDLKNRYPEAEFYFIIGEDLYLELPKWKNWKSLKQEIKFLKMEKVGIFNNRKVSSTEIRERIRQGESVEGLVPREVIKYIIENNIYK